jgi:hypothetical protein
VDGHLPPDFSLSLPFLPSDLPERRLFERASYCQISSARGQLCAFSASEADRRGKTRLCCNRRVNAERLLQASARQPESSLVLRVPVVLSVEDTMLARAGGSVTPVDAGPLRRWGDWGYVVHDAFAVVPGASFPQAWLGALIWTRSCDLHLQDHKERDPLERESRKWIDLRRQIHQRLREAGFSGRIVSLNDREGDSWASFWVAADEGHELVSRISQDRRLAHDEGFLKAYVRQQPAIGQMTMPLYGTGKNRHRPRPIEVQVRWTEVTLLPPANADHDQNEPLTMVALHLRQVGRVRGKKRFESFLLTTCPIKTDEQALEVVGWYGQRWAGEVGHDVLKNGLNLEHLPVKDVDDFKRLVALEGPVAAQITQWVELARQASPPLVTKVFDRETLAELRQACRYFKEKAPARWTTPTVVETLARLGGADVRPNRPAGWRSVLRGWRRFEEFRAIRTFTTTGKVPGKTRTAPQEAGPEPAPVGRKTKG